MKNIFTAAVILFFLGSLSFAQDTMYIHQTGGILTKIAVNKIDSIIFHATTVPAGNTVADTDGNVYNMVTIGSQIWLKENLKVTKYRNGDLIGTTTPSTLDISAESAPQYQWAYDGNESNVPVNGRVYTHYVVMDSRGICPSGWHVPSDNEWTVLSDFLTNNGYGYEGSGNDIAKSMAVTSGWTVFGTAGTTGNDQASNNSSGFMAVPSGVRRDIGTFMGIKDFCNWWTTTQFDADKAWFRNMRFDANILIRDNYSKKIAFSVRCLKD